jgi:hypothetical protein
MTPMPNDIGTPIPQPPQPPMPPAQPMVQNPAPTMAEGGTTDSSWKSWGKSANWVEIGFMILGRICAFLLYGTLL